MRPTLNDPVLTTDMQPASIGFDAYVSTLIVNVTTDTDHCHGPYIVRYVGACGYSPNGTLGPHAWLDSPKHLCTDDDAVRARVNLGLESYVPYGTVIVVKGERFRIERNVFRGQSRPTLVHTDNV
jgi:hypothetical protein